ncbi:MAG TPA: hypothetical protein VLD19_19795 [Chitinophagaceae bacterium]|nr:hypothetical protein [Chitinophagaceae bacterium]
MKKTQSANFAKFEVLNETAQGTMVGGFSVVLNATVNLLEGSNNCQGGNCVEGCGKGQNVSACNTVSGCGVKA